MGRKHFVLDTNILLHNPEAIYGFEDNDVWLPIVVIEEIDTFKKDQRELGRNAREVARHLDDLRKAGSLVDGVVLESGGKLRVGMTERELPKGFHINAIADDRILAVALHVKDSFDGESVTLVTLDTNLRIRANVLGIEAADYDTQQIDIKDLYPPVRVLDLAPGGISEFFDHGELEIPEGSVGDGTEAGGWYENEYIQLQDGNASALGRVRAADGRIDPVDRLKHPLMGIRPRNREQYFALDACLRPDIHVVTLVGKAGTGKTLMALAAGLHMVAEEERYQRLLVSRPIIPMGRDIGYLPGTIDQKLKPWVQPIHDNVEFLMARSSHGKQKRGRGVDDLVRQGIMEIEPLTYIRGRSIAEQFMIVDEAQNLTPHEIKTILTRAGEGTKIVFTGDPFQIDNPYIDSISNGLTYLIDRFRGESIAASITLRKGERSALAELAANKL